MSLSWLSKDKKSQVGESVGVGKRSTASKKGRDGGKKEEKGKPKIVSSGGVKKKVKKESFHMYIYRVLKGVQPDFGITRKSLDVMNSFVFDMYERLSDESVKLMKNSNRSTLSITDVENATRMILPGDLVKGAVSEGCKSVAAFYENEDE